MIPLDILKKSVQARFPGAYIKMVPGYRQKKLRYTVADANGRRIISSAHVTERLAWEAAYKKCKHEPRVTS